jgi:hypothetical protein
MMHQVSNHSAPIDLQNSANHLPFYTAAAFQRNSIFINTALRTSNLSLQPHFPTTINL